MFNNVSFSSPNKQQMMIGSVGALCVVSTLALAVLAYQKAQTGLSTAQWMNAPSRAWQNQALPFLQEHGVIGVAAGIIAFLAQKYIFKNDFVDRIDLNEVAEVVKPLEPAFHVPDAPPSTGRETPETLPPGLKIERGEDEVTFTYTTPSAPAKAPTPPPSQVEEVENGTKTTTDTEVVFSVEAPPKTPTREKEEPKPPTVEERDGILIITEADGTVSYKIK